MGRISLAVVLVALGTLGTAVAASADVGPLVPATTGTSPFTPGCQGVDQNGRKYHNTEPEPWIDVDPTSVGAPDGVDLIGTQQQDEEQGDGPFANGDRGKIEAHHLPLLSDAVLTRAPSCRR